MTQIDENISVKPLLYWPFRPALTGKFLARFNQVVRELATYHPDDLSELIQREIEWSIKLNNNNQAKIYNASWHLIRDLIKADWSIRCRNSTLEIAPFDGSFRPDNEFDIQKYKVRCRSLTQDSRNIALEAARDFILTLEKPRADNGKSIRDLFADGDALAKDLQAVKAISNDTIRLTKLAEVVQPYLQLVEGNARCQFTGLRLTDIWRYCRLTWSIPPYSTPGRSLFYLIRDTARPNHPLMGIISLENSPIYIGVRDDFVGWSPKSFTDKLELKWAESQNIAEIRLEFEFLLKAITYATGNLKFSDLCSEDELAEPTYQLVERLETLASQAANAREAALKRWEEIKKGLENVAIVDERDRQESEFGRVSLRAQEELFRKKRAGELARLVSARLAIEELLITELGKGNWQNFVYSERGKTALRIALVAIKNQHIGSSILELNVCGAIPPYNHLLGGKLAALLALSPQVAADYKQRYGNSRSEIASQLKGEDVVRAADLVYIGTTSLYKVGASQYNRLSLPKGLFGKNSPSTKFILLGETEGYGTLHISDETTKALEAAVDIEYMEVNHVMGEGISPKLRIIRRGVDKIFASGSRDIADQVLKHGVRRLVYGIPLAANFQSYLQNRAETPEYIWSEELSVKAGTLKIIDFWRTRWLLKRLDFAPAIEEVQLWRKENFLVSQLLPKISASNQGNLQKEIPDEASDPFNQSDVDKAGDQGRNLARNLYRGTTGFADDIQLENLHLLHVTTRLDEEIYRHIAEGRSIVLTGNPGDGKTHLLRILSEKFGPNVVVEPDASAINNQKIYENWRRTTEQGRPYALAINEAVLFRLYKDYGSSFVPISEAWEQVSNAISYDNPTPVKTDRVVVFDLSLRNPLTKDISEAIVDKLLADKLTSKCSGCPSTGCDLTRHREVLKTVQVRERLQIIFDRIILRGIHVTMRDVQAFVSYLLFADRTCDRLIKDSFLDSNSLPNLIYKGKGTLFIAAGQALDVAKIAHPILDHALITGSDKINPGGWLPESHETNGSLDQSSLSRFQQRKRIFYFYHRDGDKILDMVNDDEKAFETFLKLPEKEVLRDIIRKLNSFFGLTNEVDKLMLWQSHRYDQSSQRILYAAEERRRAELEVVKPVLQPHMASAFDLPLDHIVLRLKSRPTAKLRIDFSLFQLLLRAERGLPVLFLQPEIARRIWQFMEQLAHEQSNLLSNHDNEEVVVQVIDPALHQRLLVTLDLTENRYLRIVQERS